MANDALAGLAERLGRRQKWHCGSTRTVSAAGSPAVDAARASRWTPTSAPAPAGPQTVAGFAPLICGGLDSAPRTRMVAAEVTGWTGHPELRHQIIPSTSPESAEFRPGTTGGDRVGR